MLKPIRCFVVITLLFIFLGIFPTPTLATTIQELPLNYTATNLTGQVGGGWDTWYFTPTGGPSGSFNYVGLKGNVTMSYNGYNDATILFQIFLDRNGNCPPTGRYYRPDLAPPWSYFYRLSDGVVLASYILRTAKPGTITIPTEFTLPVKVSLAGCLGIMMNGGELNHGDPVTTTSNITFLYDTDSPPLPLSNSNVFASEICIGRTWGCEKLAPSATPDQAFARYQRFNSRQVLRSWIGNTNSAASRAGGEGICPPGEWDSTSDYYIYKAANCPTSAANSIVYAGPTVAAAQIPASAIKLYSAVVHGNQCNGGQALINKVFNPSLTVQAGDCMVQIQKFNTPQGVIAQETQSVFVAQSDIMGYLDNASCSSFVGWAGSIGDPTTPVDIHFYDGVGSAHFLGMTTANTTREKAVCDALGSSESPCNHGFVFDTPISLKDGKPYIIDAYAINGADNPKLIGSGKTITCSPTNPADLNTDGKVDIFDYKLLVGNFGKTGSNITGDIDKNGKVDIFDYTILVENFGK